MPKTSNPLYTFKSMEDHVWLLHQTLLQLTGKGLANGAKNGQTVLDSLETTSFAVVSHGTEADPVFNYANSAALKLFEMDWDAFTQLPSRKSAEAPNREERQRLLEAVS